MRVRFGSLASLGPLAFFGIALACTRPVDLVATARDAGVDAGKDVEAPPIDAPANEVGPTPHVGCGTSPAYVLLVTTGNVLFSFDPSSSEMKKIGVISCPELQAGQNVVSIASDDGGVLYALVDTGEILLMASADASGCKPGGKGVGPPAKELGAGLTLSGTVKPLAYLGLGDGLYVANATTPFEPWSALKPLAIADHVRAMLGTGDGRVFGVLAPETTPAYRVTSLDPSTGLPGATILVPTALGIAADAPAGFALWGPELLVFTDKTLTRYDFGTGALMTPEIVPGLAGIVAATSPPCASTL